ncbi:YkuS family protein [Gracilibacillus sp. S3-1-1]|uniref:YkuS family protein n=1 Tax=Gracilibacillus pellucidus TaxID=3095368 RepID=A0ACC6M0U6_9BACI|nr:YkuS family protein [Gracilibacillus sp. S3-1-1]MDX8044571.1 YkuS family protein [Gracilibacillus sp. S3-1-1]
MARIGVEESLTAVQQLLKENGHDVVTLNQEQDANGCDCCVITGLDQNMMGMENTAIQGAVINADGMNAADVYQQVEQRLGQQ